MKKNTEAAASVCLNVVTAVVSEDVDSGRSFINARKRRGPSTVPWGTPDTTSTWFELIPSRFTCCFL